MSNLKYKVGDKVRIKSLDWYNENKDKNGIVFSNVYMPFYSYMRKYCGQILTITQILEYGYCMKEDCEVNGWTDEMIEGLVEEEVDITPKFGEYSEDKTPPTEWNLPDGYQFKDENGNVINATKIVLEKKKPKYPQSYEECCKVLGVFRRYVYDEELWIPQSPEFERELDIKLEKLRELLICRDAYWKITGEDMGLGKLWEPDYETEDNNRIYILSLLIAM